MIDIRDTDCYKEKIMQKECILLNKIFEGSYTDNISNIPHEIIDFFKADDGKYYVYNNPFGDFGNHNKNYTPTYLLLTSSYIPKEKKVKIFYLIKIKEKIHNFGYDRKALANFENSNNKANQKKVIEKIIEKNITYGGQRLDKIYEENDKTYMLTFEAEWIREPKEEMFFEFNTGYNFQRNIGIVHNDEQKQAETFKRLMEKIEDSKLWKNYELDKINSEDVTNYKNPEKAEQKTFLDFICMIEREECYTNFLFNLFSENKELVKNFLMLHHLLKNKKIAEDFIICREAAVYENDDEEKGEYIGRLDVSGESQNYRFCIENKINSGLNGKDKENNTSQLGKYFKNWTSCGNHIPLSFVLVPDENKGNLDSEIGQLSKEERQIVSKNYKILTYKDLYQFLVKNSEEIKKYPFGAKFYEDILEITKRMSESKRERTKRLFLAQIAKSFSK
ncbi:MAG: hypothetical protein J5930_01210 [Treponema sp.]|nr:hypothetical protein [Treponema sp.]